MLFFGFILIPPKTPCTRTLSNVFENPIRQNPDLNSALFLTTKNFNWKSFLSSDIPRLVIAANNSYWEFWFEKKKINKSDLLKEVKEFEIEFGVEIELFETSNDDFPEDVTDASAGYDLFLEYRVSHMPAQKLKNSTVSDECKPRK